MSITLPELPATEYVLGVEGDGYSEDRLYCSSPAYDEDQMRAFAQAAITADRSAREGEAVAWRCFHCEEVFTDEASATLHFGKSEQQHPICQINAAEYREMEERMRRYNDEDGDLHRAVHAEESKGRQAAIRAEEAGYTRGLADAKKHPEELGLMIAAPADRGVAGWQPIETAPKDGTEILLSNGLVVHEGHWLHAEAYIRERRDIEGRYIDQDESEGYDGWIDWGGGMLPEPTHWQPKPQPTPKADAP